MSDKTRKSIGLLVAGAALFVVFLVLPKKFGARYSWWYPNYQVESKDPYALYFIYDLLKNSSRDFTVLEDSLTFDERDDSSAFVFIGVQMNYDSVENERLLDFVEEGHVAFIASEGLPVSLLYRMCWRKHDGSWFIQYENGEEYPVLQEDFYDEFFYDFYRDSLAVLELTLDSTILSHTLLFRSDYEVGLFNWHELGEELLCPCWSACPDEEIALRALGRIRIGDYVYENEEGEEEPLGVNFFYLPFGKGKIYLHSTPLAFTNYSLLEEEGFAYASAVFAHLPKGHIYWDSRPTFAFDDIDDVYPTLSQTPLKYVLSQPSLAWAWYLLLSSGLLFVLFMGKRRQRIVPVLVQPKNTSMEYVALIGQLTFLKGNHRKLGLEMLRLWVGYVHRHYALSLHGELCSKQASALARRSGVSQELIEKIFLLKKNVERSSRFEEPVLISLHKLLSAFYEQDRKKVSNSKPS